MAYMSRILFGGLVIDANPRVARRGERETGGVAAHDLGEAAALEARAHELYLATGRE